MYSKPPQAVPLGLELNVHRIEAEPHDPNDRFLDAFGITGTGAALVRPDGFVAWRASTLPQRPEHELQHVLTQLLARAVHNE